MRRIKILDQYKTVNTETGEINLEVSLQLDGLNRMRCVENNEVRVIGSNAKKHYYDLLGMDIYIEHRTLKYKVVRYL